MLVESFVTLCMFREYLYWGLVLFLSSSKREYVKLQKLNLRSQEIPAVYFLDQDVSDELIFFYLVLAHRIASGRYRQRFSLDPHKHLGC